MARNFAAWWIAGGFLIAIGTGVAVAMDLISVDHLTRDFSEAGKQVERPVSPTVETAEVPEVVTSDKEAKSRPLLEEEKPSLTGKRNEMPEATSVRTVRIPNSDFSPRVFEPGIVTPEKTVTSPGDFEVANNPQGDRLNTGTTIEAEKPDQKTRPVLETDIRLYFDGAAVELTSDEMGTSARPKSPLELSSGEHTIRFDMIEKSTGKTLTRTDVPLAQKQSEPERPIDGVNRIMMRKGETLWSIAKRRYGSGEQYKRIYEANRAILPSPDLVETGQVLELPE